MSLKDSLCAVELFCELPDDLVEEVIARGSTVEVGPGVPVVKQGDRGAGMVMLLEGIGRRRRRRPRRRFAVEGRLLR